jgi:hypothetical protein
MSYFVRIFSPNSSRIAPEEIRGFIEEGEYFDQDPALELRKRDDADWELEIRYEEGREPVIISTRPDDEGSRSEIRDIKSILEVSRESKKKELIAQLMESVAIVYTTRINREQITEECWVMLDNIWSMMMRKCDGFLFTPENEFFDSNLKKIYKL